MRIAAPLLTLALALAPAACTHLHEHASDRAPADAPPSAATSKNKSGETDVVLPRRFPAAATQRMQQYGRRPAQTKDVLRIEPVDGGMTWPSLFEFIAKETGVSIRYEEQSAIIKGRKIVWVGTTEVARADLVAWAQDLAVTQGLVIAQQGPADRRTYIAMDTSNPWVTAQPTFVEEQDLPRLAGRNGLYVACVLTLPQGLDPSRARNAITQLSTLTAGLGRVADFGKTDVILVADFAAVVASMQRLLDQMATQLYEESVK